MRRYIEEQHRIDPENMIHGSGQYAVWNLKVYMLEKVARLNPFGSEFFIFTDSGAWRNFQFTNWPDNTFSRRLVEQLANRPLFGQINPFERSNFSIQNDIIEGRENNFC